jgi:hypothetical protein
VCGCCKEWDGVLTRWPSIAEGLRVQDEYSEREVTVEREDPHVRFIAVMRSVPMR